MRILLTGATGLIGSALAAAMLRAGHEVVGVTRRPVPTLSGVIPLPLDLRDATSPEVWRPHLQAVDAVINCVGVLQDNAADSIEATHVLAPRALFQACERAGVRRVIHISGIGSDRETPTRFSATKAQGETALQATTLDWVILRPSVVVGPAAYGGSALLRGLAAAPFALDIPDTGALQIVQLDDLVATVLFFLDPAAPTRLALDIAGPEQQSFGEAIATYRRWLGRSPGLPLRLPPWLMRFGGRLGDVAGRLGWRPPIRTTALLEIHRGATGDIALWRQITGIEPRSLARALRETPVSVQERWFANLYLLKPVLIGTLSVFWVTTGIITLGPAWSAGNALMQEAGLSGLPAAAMTAGGALADILIGLGIACRRTCRAALFAAIAVSLGYLLLGTLLLPRLWADPLGAFVKIVPILALHVAVLAILEDR